jgi:hypothetical protein
MLTALSKTKMMLNRARSRIDAKEKEEKQQKVLPARVSLINESDTAIGARTSHESLKSVKSDESQRTIDLKKSIEEIVSQQSKPGKSKTMYRQRVKMEGLGNDGAKKLAAPQHKGRRNSVASNLGIYSTTSNSNQRSAKCAQTNEKKSKLHRIEGLLEIEEEDNDRSDRRGSEQVPSGKMIPLEMKLPKLQNKRKSISVGMRGQQMRKASLLNQDETEDSRKKRQKGFLEAHLRKKSMGPQAFLDRSKSIFQQDQQVMLLDRYLKQDITKIHIDEVDKKVVDETVASQVIMNEMIVLERNHHQHIQALLSDVLSGGIFYQYLMMNASFEVRSILCLSFIQDLQMLEDCFSLLDKIQKAAAFEAILIKNVPTAETILNELPGIRTHWNYLLKLLSTENNWITIPWRMYAIKLDAVKLLLVEYARFVRFSRSKFVDQILKCDAPHISIEFESANAGRPRSSIVKGNNNSPRASIMKSRNMARTASKNIEIEAKFDLEGFDELDSDQDSDEENEKIDNKIEQVKKEAIREQLLSSLPIGRRRKFKRKQLTEFETCAQLGYFFGNQILRGCFNILSKDDQLPSHILQLHEKAFLNHRPLPTTELQQHSLVQYPQKGDMIEASAGARIVEKQKRRPVYLCSIRKNGQILRRPTKRPANFLEILKDPSHHEFFARYLKALNSDGPLLFWKSVEYVKTMPDPEKRRVKIKTILKKFFHWSKNELTTIVRLTKTIHLLNCNADIIKDIIDMRLENVNIIQLVAAQTAVQRCIEKTWESRYYKTFVEVETNEEDKKKTETDFTDKNKTDTKDDSKVNDTMNSNSNAWRVFTLFIKRSAMFIKGMKSQSIRQEFRKYLQDYAKEKRQTTMKNCKEKDIAYEIPSRANSVCKIYPFHLYDAEDPLMNMMTMKYEMTGGKNVYSDLLVNDLDFWLEVQLFQETIDTRLAKMADDKGHGAALDIECIKEKIRLITCCYLHSHVPPKVRINADHELARGIHMYTLGLGEHQNHILDLDRSIFHEIVLQIFPVMIQHWSVFCNKKYKYCSKKTIAYEKMERAKLKSRQIDARRQRQKVRMLKKHGCKGGSQYGTPDSSDRK